MREKIKDFLAKRGAYYEPSKKKEGEELPYKDKTELDKEAEERSTGIKKGDEALEYFKTRRSIRRFSPEMPDWKIIYNIIDAALHGPLAGNLCNIDIIAIQNKEKIKKISMICAQQSWICEAPIVLAVVRRDTFLLDLYPGEGEKFSIQNAAAATENILMLAHFYGLGACWVESFENEVLHDELGVGSERFVDAIIPLGFAREKPKNVDRRIDDFLYFESFGNRTRPKAPGRGPFTKPF
ncbi:nitroreductase family protein [Candidatus Woesearchaeota archaeon]|nr:nitroreductase family protein [Nanoarchaeota archaeon]MCB9371148.1 nitroreductase family protein [Candidatus Woesearchaeota archaeon]USN43857.1 MAG: nitroreductase family protein [Candidatus Woesearchaeota archaeon]